MEIFGCGEGTDRQIKATNDAVVGLVVVDSHWVPSTGATVVVVVVAAAAAAAAGFLSLFLALSSFRC